MAIWVGLLALFSMGVVAACQTPEGGTSASPGSTSAPVAPAIETDHPDAESPIALPGSPVPVAPAIEVDHPDAESPIPLPSPPEAP